MPLMLELKYEHFIGTWPGRIKCVELVRKLLTLNGLVSTYLAETESRGFLVQTWLPKEQARNVNVIKAAASMTSCQTTRMPPPIGESRRSIAAVHQVSVDDLPYATPGLQLLPY